MIHKFESQDGRPNLLECKCLLADDQDPEYYETFAFCTDHSVWWSHEVGSWRSWEQVNPQVEEALIPDWMRVQAYGALRRNNDC